MADKLTKVFLYGILCIISVLSVTASTNSSCDPPCLYITNLTSILRVPLNGTTGKNIKDRKPEVLFRNRGHIRSLEIDPVNEKLYWGDFKYHTINSSDLDGGNRRTLLKYAVGYAQGIAVDWSTNNMYWTDSLMDMIEVSDVNGYNRKVLFKLDEGAEPRGIIVNPITGQLFWTDWGKSPKIERSSLSGTDRVTIVSDNLTWPNDLAIDHSLQRLFWVDAKHDVLFSSNYDGKSRRLHYEILYNNGIVHPYSMAYSAMHKIAYFSDWQTDSVYVDTHMDGENVTAVFKNNGRRRNIGQIRLLESNRVKALNPCANNTCSHMCFNDGSSRSYKCGCPTGMVLGTDQMNCISTNRRYEMFFADSFADTVNHLVKYHGQEGFTIRQLPVPSNEKLESPIALDYDPYTEYVYWSDHKTKKVYRMHENGGKNGKFEVVLNGKITFGLALDEINRLLYWFEDDKNLVVSSLNGEDKRTLVKGLYEPRDIALYEEKGYVFFNDYQAGRIYRINADGTNLIFLKTRYKVVVTGIAVDKVSNRVYWCDHDDYSIEYTDLNFQNRHKIVQKTFYLYGRFWLINNEGNVISPFDIAVLGDKIFWTDTYKRAIFSANKDNGGHIEYVTGGLDHPRDLHVFRDEPANDYRTVNMVTHLPYRSSSKRAKCFASCPSASEFNTFPNPGPCPVGYKQTRYNQTCANCSDALGGSWKCQCNDWMTCAQRGAKSLYACHPNQPMILLKVRECKQVVKPGYCPYQSTQICLNSTPKCNSDDDCSGTDKCCEGPCGKFCRASVTKSDHPCTKNNGGCSHFCVVEPAGGKPKCLCPDGLYIGTDGKTCGKTQPVSDVCPKSNLFSSCQFKKNNCLKNSDCSSGKLCCKRGCGNECLTPVKSFCYLDKEIGSCKASLKRWYFNKNTLKCEIFSYGGCDGNNNRFSTENECLKTCKPDASTKNQCDPNPCKNGGVCQATGTACKCAEFFAGKLCETNVEQGVVSIVLKTSAVVTEEEFKKSVAQKFTTYCRKYGCETSASTRRRRLTPLPSQTVEEKDVIIYRYEQKNDGIHVVFAVLFTDHNGKPALMKKTSITAASSVPNLVDGQTGTAQFVSLNPPKKRGRTKSNVSLVVGLMMVVIILAVLVMGGYWYYKRRKSMEQMSTARSSGPVTFENRLYEDLHGNKVKLPEQGASAPDQSRYESPVKTNLAEYASPMPPPATLEDYAEVAAARNFVLPTYEQANAPTSEKEKNWVKFDDEKQKSNWVQFHEESNKINDFAEPRYTNPYDLDGVSSPSASPQHYSNISSPEHEQSVSLADLKSEIDEKLPSVDDSPRVYENVENGNNNPQNNLDNLTQINVNSSHTEC